MPTTEIIVLNIDLLPVSKFQPPRLKADWQTADYVLQTF